MRDTGQRGISHTFSLKTAQILLISHTIFAYLSYSLAIIHCSIHIVLFISIYASFIDSRAYLLVFRIKN